VAAYNAPEEGPHSVATSVVITAVLLIKSVSTPVKCP
jgi:hypothetical protein